MNELRAKVISQEKGTYKIQSGTAGKLPLEDYLPYAVLALTVA